MPEVGLHVFNGGVGTDLFPGETHDWTATGWSFGQVVQITAWPLGGAPSDKSIAVVDTRVHATSSGDTVIEFGVRNEATGANADAATYRIFMSWTDVVPDR